MRSDDVKQERGDEELNIIEYDEEDEFVDHHSTSGQVESLPHHNM